MSIPQLETCCCGCTLRTGTKIIGWLSLIGSILMVITLGTTLTALYYIGDHPDEAKTEEAKVLLAHLPAIKVLTIFAILVYICSCTLAFILLLGTYQNKANLVFIWVVFTLTAAILSLANGIGQQMTVGNPGQALSHLIIFVVDLYFILVVYSFYREIRNVSTYP